MDREEIEFSSGAKKVRVQTQHLPLLLAVLIVVGYSVYIIEFKLSEIRTKQDEIMRHLIVLEETSRKNLQMTEQTHSLLKQWTSPGMWR